jgi:hypothetical protein
MAAETCLRLPADSHLPMAWAELSFATAINDLAIAAK